MTKKKGTLQLTAKEISAAKHLAALGRSTRSIARELGRSPHTIARLLQQPAVATEVVTKKGDLADLYERLTLRTLESIGQDTIEDASLQQRAVSAGIFTDKFRLLRDQSTGNLDIRVLTDVCDLIRRKRDRDDDLPTQSHRVLSVAPEPNSLPIAAGYSHVASPPIREAHPAKAQQPAMRVTYHAAKEVEPDSANYNPLLHGLPK